MFSSVISQVHDWYCCSIEQSAIKRLVRLESDLKIYVFFFNFPGILMMSRWRIFARSTLYQVRKTRMHKHNSADWKKSESFPAASLSFSAVEA